MSDGNSLESILQYNQENLDKIGFVTTKRSRPALLFITADTITKRQEAFEQVKAISSEYVHVEINLAAQKFTSLYLYLKQVLPEDMFQGEGIRYMVHIFGLEYKIVELTDKGLESTRLIPEINFERELLFRDLPCVLVFWTDEYTINRLQKEAGDFWDWVTYRYHFRTLPEEIENAPIIDPEVSQVPGDLEERRKRIEDLEGRLARLDRTAPHAPRTMRDEIVLRKALAQEYLHRRGFDKALEHLDIIEALAMRLPKESVDMGEVYFIRGNIFVETENFIEAEKVFNKILADYSPYNALVYHNLGSVYLKKGEYQLALEYTIKALDLYEKVAIPIFVGRAHHQLGIIYQEMRDWQKALESFFKAVSFKEKTDNKQDIGSSYFHIGRVYQLQRNPEAAAEYFEKALSVSPAHEKGGVLYQIGTLLFAIGEWAGGLEFINSSIESFIENGIPHHLSFPINALKRLRRENLPQYQPEISRLLQKAEQYAKEHKVKLPPN